MNFFKKSYFFTAIILAASLSQNTLLAPTPAELRAKLDDLAQKAAAIEAQLPAMSSWRAGAAPVAAAHVNLASINLQKAVIDIQTIMDDIMPKIERFAAGADRLSAIDMKQKLDDLMPKLERITALADRLTEEKLRKLSEGTKQLGNFADRMDAETIAELKANLKQLKTLFEKIPNQNIKYTILDKDGKKVEMERPATQIDLIIKNAIHEANEKIEKNGIVSEIKKLGKKFAVVGKPYVWGPALIALSLYIFYKIFIQKPARPALLKLVQLSQTERIYKSLLDRSEAEVVKSAAIEKLNWALGKISTDPQMTLIVQDKLNREQETICYSRSKVDNNIGLVSGRVINELFSTTEKQNQLHEIFTYATKTRIPIWICQAKVLLANQDFFEWRRLFFPDVKLILSTSEELASYDFIYNVQVVTL